MPIQQPQTLPTVSVGAATAPSVTNIAKLSVSTATNDTQASNNTATDPTNVIPSADLTITKTDGQTSTTPGSPISYTITVTNNGPSTVNSITVTDDLPSSIQNPTFTASTGTYNSSTGAWTGLNLASGQSVTLTVSGTVATTATSTISNTAKVAPPSGVTDPNTGNNSATDTTSVLAPPTIDLDENDSSGATGNNYQNTFTGGGQPVSAANADVKITDNNSFINSATITLTNRPDGNANESLSIDPTAGNTVSGVTASAYDPATGKITLTSNTSDTITPAQYQPIIATLKYNNTAASPNSTNRTINVQVTDSDGLTSNTAVSTISVRLKASLLLVKRVTAINSQSITTVVDDSSEPNDNTNLNWPSGFLQGAIAGSVQPQ